MAAFEGPSFTQQVNGNLVVNDDGTGNYGKITGSRLFTQGGAVLLGQGAGEALTSGEAIFPRTALSGGPALVTQQLQLAYWTAATSGTATSVITESSGTAAAGLTYAAIGVYSVDGSGNLTLVGSTADLHTTLWIATFTTYTSPLTTSFTRTAGQRYALGFLAVGTTPPTLVGPPGNNFYTLAPIVAGLVSGQAALPASVAAGSITATFQAAEAVVTP